MTRSRLRRLRGPVLVAVLTATYAAALVPAAVAVVNGTPATLAEATALHQVSLVQPASGGAGASLVCSATVLNPQWIITAAHCARPGQPLRVRSGGVSWQTATYERSITEVRTAPALRGANPDMALLRVSPPLDDGGPPFATEREPDGSTVQIVGWGAVDAASSPSTALRTAVTTSVPGGRCGAIGPADMCLEDRSGAGASPCFGDSGGGVLVRRSWGWMLVGVVAGSGQTSKACSGSAVAVATAPVSSWIVETLRIS